MVSLTILFWIFLILFAIVGAMRGMAKEILVTFSVVLALFFIVLLELYFPLMKPDSDISNETRFWIQAGTIGVMVFIGYQTPRLPAFTGPKFMRQRIQDTLLGLIVGGMNGYLIVGSIWWYMEKAEYFPPYILAPDPGTEMGQTAINMLNYMPPEWLVAPWIYFAIAVAFLLVLWLFV